MNSLRFQLFAGVIATLGCFGPPAAAQDPVRTGRDQANIIIILADDMGYGDLGVQSGGAVETPHLDRLATQGARLTNFYSNQTVCAPSRAGLLTGMYQHRFGFEHNPGRDAGRDFGIPLEQPTIAERLKEQGYATGMVGKWHIGSSRRQTPTARGFDSFYGLLGGAMAYTPEGPTGSKVLWRGTERVPMADHTTEAFADEAVTFIESNKDKPFFLYVAFNAVHAPMQSTKAYLDRFPDESDPKRRAFLAMLAAMDDAVGDIVAAVDENGLASNTLIAFTSDNGGPTWQTTSSNGPLNGVKALVLEGGIRVPTIVRWVGVVPPNTTSDSLGFGADLTATALAAASAPEDATLDGVDLRPFLTGEKSGDAHEQLFWRYGVQGAMREGNWKLVTVYNATYLFNLESDLGEHVNVAEQEPERLARMKARWDAWSGEMPQPSWTYRRTPDGRNARLQELVDNYIRERPVEPRPLLYGGGPE